MTREQAFALAWWGVFKDTSNGRWRGFYFDQPIIIRLRALGLLP